MQNTPSVTSSHVTQNHKTSAWLVVWYVQFVGQSVASAGEQRARQTHGSLNRNTGAIIIN